MNISLLVRSLFAAAAGAALVACASPELVDLSGGGGGVPSAAPSPTTCPACVMDSDCTGGATCAQFGGDTYCAKPCPNGNECGSGTTCTPESSSSGDPVSVCVPDNNACGATPTPRGTDAGGAPPSACPGLADPNTTASCTSCKSGGKTCQANGCYGGWWCDTTTDKCQPAPSSCGAPGGGGGVDAGPVSASINENGGTESKLYFAIVGDTRPAVIDDTSAYPTTTITKIWDDIKGMSPMPPFAVATGDYQFSSAYGSEAAKQLSLYTGASSGYRGAGGIEFPAMGNHECTGATASNCASSTTNNYDAFTKALLSPIGKTLPYYSINVNATDSSWTAKFVFVAANYWDSTQSAWLDKTLSAATTYTFVIRHESATANTAPGVTPSEKIMAAHPLTLAIVGHAHTYSRPSTKEVIFGNGGAPLVSGAGYGYGLVTQRSDGAIQVDEIDMSTGTADTSFRFALKADGTPAP